MGVALFIVEMLALPKGTADTLFVFSITILPAMGFTVLSAAELKGIDQQRRLQSQTLIGTYILFKGIRLLLTLLVVLLYVMFDGSARIPFIVNIGVLFLGCLCLTSYCHLRAEAHDNPKPEANRTTE